MYLLSVVIPAFNCSRYLADAIDSVVTQSVRPLELIIVDDGSTDATASVAGGFGPAARYIYQAHAGIGVARNRGIEAARGEFLAFLDADDLWSTGKVEKQLVTLNSSSEIDMVFGHVEQFPSPELSLAEQESLRYATKPLPGYVAGTMLIRRETFLRVGRFGSHWQVGEFVDWYLRAIETGLKGIMLPDVLLRRRLHATNQGIRKRAELNDYARVLAASLRRRRRGDFAQCIESCGAEND